MDQFFPSGFLLVYKPTGISSYAVVNLVKKTLKKMGISHPTIGHTGTLDPFAEGLLAVCIGEASKLSQIFLSGEKTYEACLSWGQATTTGDPTGEALLDCVSPDIFFLFKDAEIISGLEKFKNQYTSQIPPMYSAKQIDGKRLYVLARQGIEIERTAHPVHLSSLELLRVERNENRIQNIWIRVGCSGGTYVRTLAEDLAKNWGGFTHLTKLIRTKITFFELRNSLACPFSEEALEEFCDHIKHCDSKEYASTSQELQWIPLSQIIRKKKGPYEEFHVSKSLCLAIQHGKLDILHSHLNSVDSENPSAHWGGIYSGEKLIALVSKKSGTWKFVRGFTALV